MPMRRGSITARNFGFATLILNIGKMLAKYGGATYTEEIQQAKLEKVRLDAQLVEARKQKVFNDLVIQDLEIAKRKKKLGMAEDGQEWKPIDQ